MLELGLKTLLSYLIGSVNGSLVLGRLFGVDVRRVGSGNPGATNALRAHGKWFALGVAVIDVAKGYLPTALLPGMLLFGIAHDPAVDRNWLIVACAFAAVVGHCYPVWHGFAGGKGAATAIGALGAFVPWVIVPLVAAWLSVLVLFGYVGLATIIAFAFAFATYLGFADPLNVSVATFLAGLAAFVLFTHRSNIARLRSGTENRMERAMLFRRRHDER